MTLCFYQSALPIAVIEISIRPTAAANRYPIVDILSFTSIVDMVFNRLSNVRLLHGMDTNPQANASLWLYGQPMLRKIYNVLLESSLNHHILTIKHLRITVGEYVYGLLSFFGKLGHGIQQPIRYRMLKSMDQFNLSKDNLWNSLNQYYITEVSFKLYGMDWKWI
jgi:hypothetical protein